jgi:hypothetical protein
MVTKLWAGPIVSERTGPPDGGRPLRRRRASTPRAFGDGARCKNDMDSTTEGAVRAGCGTVGRVTGEAQAGCCARGGGRRKFTVAICFRSYKLQSILKVAGPHWSRPVRVA